MSSMLSEYCFALVDCNNFYASCERLFQPALINKPIIVLSSNDGCVIARSNEAKALGIQMSQPYFQIEKLCKQHQVSVFSSNFALYGDISQRIMTLLKQDCPDMEVYSIDEAFLRLDKIAFADPLKYAHILKEKILKNIGIPISIGLAKTKTLAKMAAKIAKNNHLFSKNQVCDLREDAIRHSVFQEFPIQDIWGIGKKTAQALQYMKINSAADILKRDSTFLKKRFSIMLLRIVLELQNVSCLTLADIQQKKRIICSRSFGKSVIAYSALKEAVSAYAARACEKARKEKVKAQAVMVYARSSAHTRQSVFYSAADITTLLYPSNDTCHIVQVAQKLLKKIYKAGVSYQKIGIILCELIPESLQQGDLFHTKGTDNAAAMKTLDAINRRYGGHSVFLAAEGISPFWRVKSTHRSPCYTTDWQHLRVVKADVASYTHRKTQHRLSGLPL